MAQAGQVIEGPGGFQLRLVKTGAETGGELLEMEATYGGSDALPPEHFHTWLHEHHATQVEPFIDPIHPEGMMAHHVSTMVNEPQHDDRPCNEPEEPHIGGL